MKFRFHAGGLKESLATAIEITNMDMLKRIIEERISGYNMQLQDLRFDYYCYDHRINWNTYLVMCKFTGYEYYVPVGMSDGFLAQ